MFADFDSSLLDDAEFKEDSVREVIIAPILARLGFTASGPNRVVRSRSLKHPFIYAGTRQIPITLIPDYTLLCDEKPVFVLDAKRPTEDVLERKIIQQAYSYAIHPEIKANEFGLCNGTSLAIFSVDDAKPLVVIPFHEFDERWDEIERILAPKLLRNPILRKFAPDFGAALRRLGLKDDAKILMLGMGLNLFARISDELITASANTEFAEKEHCVSVDFHPKLLDSMLSALPTPLGSQFKDALSRAPFQAAAEAVVELDLEMLLGDDVDNGNEQFVPLIVENVVASRFNFSPTVRAADCVVELR